MDRSRVAIVIPALNESLTIKGVVELASKYGIPIVVDDGSIDDTSNLALIAGGVVVSHEYTRGYDAALNSGFKKASEIGCDLIITLDADGQHDPNLIKEFIDNIDAGADVVVGVRSNRQRLAEDIFALYTKNRYKISDPLCGMKAYKTNVYKDLGHFDSYESIGTELMLFAAKNKYSLKQIEFIAKDRLDTSRFGHVLLGNYKIFRAMLLSFVMVKMIDKL